MASDPHQPTAGDAVDRKEVVTNVDRPPLLSWSAVFGGLVFLIAISWLLNLFGAALGGSVADSTDGDAIGQGLAMGVIVWMVVSALIAFFVGALLTARLSGKVDSTVGMLHGFTLWGVAVTLIVLLSYLGVTNLIQTGFQLVKGTASVATSAASGIASGAAASGELAADAIDSSMADNIRARVKRRAARVVARSEAEGGTEVTAEEVQQAMDSLNTNTLEQVALHITMGELTDARETLAAESGLSDNEVREIVDGIANEFEERLGTEDNDTGLVGDVTNAVQAQTADFVANQDAQGGPNVSQQNVRRALEEMTPETLQTVATRLVNGDTQGAKDALAANTNLSVQQINDVVEGVRDDISSTVEQYRQEAMEAVEAASTYTQAVLWTAFVAAAMGLAVSLLGGWLGAESSRTLYVERRENVA